MTWPYGTARIALRGAFRMAKAGRFCEAMMSHLTDFLQTLTVSQGRRAGEALTVLPWQRKFVAGAFAPGRTTAALSVARGNGKTTLVCRDRVRRRSTGRWRSQGARRSSWQSFAQA